MIKKSLSYLHASSNQELGCQERYNENVCKGLQVFPKCLHMAHKNTKIMCYVTFLFVKSHFCLQKT